MAFFTRISASVQFRLPHEIPIRNLSVKIKIPPGYSEIREGNILKVLYGGFTENQGPKSEGSKLRKEAKKSFDQQSVTVLTKDETEDHVIKHVRTQFANFGKGDFKTLSDKVDDVSTELETKAAKSDVKKDLATTETKLRGDTDRKLKDFSELMKKTMEAALLSSLPDELLNDKNFTNKLTEQISAKITPLLLTAVEETAAELGDRITALENRDR